MAQWASKEMFLAWGTGHPRPKADYYPVAWGDVADYCWYPAEVRQSADDETFPRKSGEGKAAFQERAMQECKRRNGKAYRSIQGASNRLSRG